MQERVCAGAAANRGGWIADEGLDGGRARRRIIKWIRGLEGRRPKNEGLPQTTKIREGRARPREGKCGCAISGPTFDDLWTSFHHSRGKRVNADPHRENVVLDQILMLRKTFFRDISIRPLHPKQTSLCRVRCECMSGRGERVHKVSPHHRTRSRPVTLSPHRSPRAGRMIEDDAYYCPISPPRRATATAAAAAVNVWPRSISRGHGVGEGRSFSS